MWIQRDAPGHDGMVRPAQGQGHARRDSPGKGVMQDSRGHAGRRVPTRQAGPIDHRRVRADIPNPAHKLRTHKRGGTGPKGTLNHSLLTILAENIGKQAFRRVCRSLGGQWVRIPKRELLYGARKYVNDFLRSHPQLDRCRRSAIVRGLVKKTGLTRPYIRRVVNAWVGMES